MVNTLALDLGTKTGWATYDNGTVDSDTELLATEKALTEARKLGAERTFDIRFRNLMCLVLSKIRQHKIRQIVFEDVIFLSSQSQAQLWASLRGAVWGAVMAHELAEANSVGEPVSIQCVPVGTLKLFATGKGNAQKEQMAESLKLVYPGLFTGRQPDDNEIDAIWLLWYALAVDRGEVSFSSIWSRKQAEKAAKKAKAKVKAVLNH